MSASTIFGAEALRSRQAADWFAVRIETDLTSSCQFHNDSAQNSAPMTFLAGTTDQIGTERA